MKRAEAVDRIGQIDAEIAALLEERQQLVTQKFSERVGVFEGDDYRLSGYMRNNTRLDLKKVQRKLGVEGAAACYSSSKSFCIRVTPKAIQ